MSEAARGPARLTGPIHGYLGRRHVEAGPIWIDYHDSRSDGYEVDTVIQRDVLVINLGPAKTVFGINGGKPVELPVSTNMHSFVPAGTEVYERCEAQSTDCLFLHFDEGALADLRAHNDVRDATPEFRYQMVDPVLGGLARELARSIATGMPEGAAYAEYIGAALALRQMGQMMGQVTRPRMSTMPMSVMQVAQLQEFIEARLSEALSLAEVCDAADRPLALVNRAFRECLGLSVYQYILMRRIDRAREKLAVSDASLAEIAYECGFSSQQHMTNAFTAKLGTSPGRYRREVKG